jgi:hypothetical protein
MQALLERNLGAAERALVLDFKDEYRGLCEAGLANFYVAGPAEAAWSVQTWQDLLDDGPLVLVRREDVQPAGWREVCAGAIRAARRLDGECPVYIDEAHFVAPQSEGYPEVIDGLATTGRGEGSPSMWVTQRLSLIDKTPTSLVDAHFLGGFGSDDVSRVGDVVEGYPAAVHNPLAEPDAARLPPEIVAEDGTTAVRKFEDGEGHLIGSEWIYGDDSGDRARFDTRGLELETTHYSPRSVEFDLPV